MSSRVELNFNTKTSLSALAQWNDDNEEFLLNIRFSYEYRPGSNIFLVYSGTRDLAEDIQDYSIILKIKHVLRL